MEAATNGYGEQASSHSKVGRLSSVSNFVRADRVLKPERAVIVEDENELFATRPVVGATCKMVDPNDRPIAPLSEVLQGNGGEVRVLGASMSMSGIWHELASAFELGWDWSLRLRTVDHGTVRSGGRREIMA